MADGKKWAGWIAALGGLLCLGHYAPSIAGWAVPLGSILAIVFGIWAVFQ